MEQVDQSGVDLYKLNENYAEGESESRYFEIAIQCKAFDGNFEKSQLKQCLNSIEKFIYSGKKATSYYIIINRNIALEDHKAEIQTKLKLIVSEGIANIAELITVDGVFEFLAKQSKGKLIEIMHNSARFIIDNNNSDAPTLVIRDVPFSENGIVKTSPYDSIKNDVILRISHNMSNPMHMRPPEPKIRDRTFVIGEFGFGKSTFLLELCADIINSGGLPVFIAAAHFKDAVLDRIKDFLNTIIDVVISRTNENDDEAFGEETKKFFRSSMESIFKSSSNVVLIIDGLDENPNLYSDSRLKVFFECLHEFKCYCIFGVRKEFWDERAGTFENALMKIEKRKREIYLMEWEQQQMNEFVTKHERNCTADQMEFIRIIKSGTYNERYGSIPKRPLFLSMLMDDARDSNIKNIASLYDTYFTRKLSRDRNPTHHQVERPFFLSGQDVFYQSNLMLKILIIASSKMFIIDENGKYILKPTITSCDFEKICKEVHGDARIIDVIIHSVIVTVSKRTKSNLELMFSHKSFQEWVFAKYAIENNLNPENLPDGVNNFIKHIKRETL